MIFTFHASRITLSTAATSTIDYHLLLTFYIRNGDLRSLQLVKLNNTDEIHPAIHIALLPDKSGFKTGAQVFPLSRFYRHIAPLERKAKFLNLNNKPIDLQHYQLELVPSVINMPLLPDESPIHRDSDKPRAGRRDSKLERKHMSPLWGLGDWYYDACAINMSPRPDKSGFKATGAK